MTFVDDIFSQTIIVFSTFGCISHAKGREKVREIVCMNEWPCQQLSAPVFPVFLKYICVDPSHFTWDKNSESNAKLWPVIQHYFWGKSVVSSSIILSYGVPDVSIFRFLSTYLNLSAIPCYI